MADEFCSLNNISNPGIIHPLTYNASVTGLTPQMINNLTTGAKTISQIPVHYFWQAPEFWIGLAAGVILGSIVTFTIIKIIKSTRVRSQAKKLSNVTPDKASPADYSHWISRLNLGPSDIIHMKGLMRKLGKAVSLIIGQNFLPSALLTPQQRQDLLGAEDYSTIAKDASNASIAKKDVVVTFNPMDGGLGSNIIRESYLEETLGRPKDDPKTGRAKIGAKATDFYFINRRFKGKDINGKAKFFKISLSIAEMKLLRVINDASYFAKAFFQPLVSSESAPSYVNLLNSIYLPDRIDENITKKRTYRQIMEEKGVKLYEQPDEMLYQMDLPIIDLETGNLTDTTNVVDATKDKYTAPGGHGQWGVMLLYEALDSRQPSGDDKVHIRVFYNGDGVANFPDASILGWMAKNKVAIVMVSTTKAGLDRKGGQIGVQRLENRSFRVQMLELAQAKKPGKENEQLFYSIGLPGKQTVLGKDVLGDLTKDYTYTNEAGGRYFNTNLALINDSILGPILQKLSRLSNIEFEGERLSGRELIERIISPDLIENVKEKKDGKKYTQLEGAIGSCLLNLNAFFSATKDPRVKAILQETLGSSDKKLLRIVNVDITKRTRFFTPIKNAFDYWLQAYSDYYKIYSRRWTLIDRRKGQVPPLVELNSYKKDGSNQITLDKDKQKVSDKFYDDVQNVINSFGRASTRKLNSLTITERYP